MITLLRKPWFPYVVPFVLFLLLTELSRIFPEFTHIIYIIKTIFVGVLLWLFRHKYRHDFSGKLSIYKYLAALITGVLVLIIWVAPEEYLFQAGESAGFDPYSFGWSSSYTVVLIAVRIMGASLVVPVMEELFWRSFILRYLINPDFQKIPLGTFTWFSFTGTAILFGLEHHRIIPGVIAGIIYNLIIIRQKKLMGCIVAHGVTNWGLGIYVLMTKNWTFW